VATEPVETAPLPLAATSDKQARLERLRATAIEVPEPEVQPAATGAPTEATPEVSREILAFDEGFLWSAEILASQGRRPEDVSA